MIRGITFALSLWMVAAVYGQKAPDAGVPVFRSSAELVRQVVTVVDNRGNPLERLHASDFVVTEDGIVQSVRFCDFQRIDEGSSVTVADAPSDRSESTVSSTKSAKTRHELQYRDRRLLVLYFDLSTMPAADLWRAVTAGRRFVDRQMTSVDVVSVMAYDGGAVKIRQDFTADREILREALGKIAPTIRPVDDDDISGEFFPADSAFGQDSSEFNLFNTDRQLSALQTAANMLGTVPEKKSLIYITSGLRLRGVDNQAQLRATLNAAIRANVIFFPIDARGLVAQAPMGGVTQGALNGIDTYTGWAAMATMKDVEILEDTLYSLAADTGGKALLGTNDLSIGMAQAQKATSSYYIIGYQPTNAAVDGKFRRIKITLKEYPSAKLEYRRGYYARKTFGKLTSAEKERQLEEALMLEDPITDLAIAMEVNYFQLSRAEYYVPLAIRIPGNELLLAQRTGAKETRIDFIGEIKDMYGYTVQNIRDAVDIRLDVATAAELFKRHILYDAGYTLLPGSYYIKVLVRESQTGRIGTYMRKVTIPNLSKETERIPVSSVVLSTQLINLREALFTAGKDKRQATNPLVNDGQKLMPSVTRVFRKSNDMFVYLQAYETDAGAVLPLVAYVTLYHGHSKTFETAPLIAPMSEMDNNGMRIVPLAFKVALAELPSSAYTCQVTVLDPTRRKAAFWRAQILVMP